MSDYAEQPFIVKGVLSKLFKQGRFARQQTLFPTTISATDVTPPEAGFQDKNGKSLGVAWQYSLQALLDEAAHEGLKDHQNPNIAVIRRVVQDMQNLRERTSERPPAQILSLARWR